MVPVGLSIGKAGDSQVLSRTAHGPTSLGDPDRLAARSSCGVVVGLEKRDITSLNRVILGILEVWVRIHTNEIRSGDDSVVGGVHPGSPCIDMADGSPTQWSVRYGSTDLADVVGDDVWTSSDTIVAGNAGR